MPAVTWKGERLSLLVKLLVTFMRTIKKVTLFDLVVYTTENAAETLSVHLPVYFNRESMNHIEKSLWRRDPGRLRNLVPKPSVSIHPSTLPSHPLLEFGIVGGPSLEFGKRHLLSSPCTLYQIGWNSAVRDAWSYEIRQCYSSKTCNCRTRFFMNSFQKKELFEGSTIDSCREHTFLHRALSVRVKGNLR